MQSGFSKNWAEVLGELTDGRVRKLDAGAIREYFKPLTEYLREQRSKLNYTIGWDKLEYVKFYSS